jgi:hypothetical protein
MQKFLLNTTHAGHSCRDSAFVQIPEAEEA